MFILLICIGICFSVAGLGSIFTNMSVKNWYTTIQKPSWTPPNWVFGPVWSFLYLCMGISLWLIWVQRKNISIKLSCSLFGIQMILNLLWSLFFFGLKNPMLAMVDIAMLLVAIVATIISLLRYRNGSLDSFPLFFWVLFASFLNYSIWKLNTP